MTLAEKYGIQKGKEVEAISLNENPYKFEGTFKEFYELVAGGRVKALKQYGTTVGISVGGYETIEADNLAGKAFAEAYGPMQAMRYLDLATQLVEANLIPTVISENPLKITILNGLVTLDEYGNEIKEAVKEETTTATDTGVVFTVDDVDYEIVDNPITGKPMIARVDGEKVTSRRAVAIEYLLTQGYDLARIENKKTSWLEREVANTI